MISSLSEAPESVFVAFALRLLPVLLTPGAVDGGFLFPLVLAAVRVSF